MGRDAEFREFVASSRGRLLRTARLLPVGDAYRAEDVVQTALTRLYVHWDKVRSDDGPARYTDKAAQESTRPIQLPSAATEPYGKSKPWAPRPVPLVRDDKPARGTTLHCSLAPKGWRTEGRYGYIRPYDPKSTYPTHAPDPHDHTWSGAGDGNEVTIGLFGDKVGTGWKARVQAHIGRRT